MDVSLESKSLPSVGNSYSSVFAEIKTELLGPNDPGMVCYEN